MIEQAWNYRSSVQKNLNNAGESGGSKIHYYKIDNAPLIHELESLGYTAIITNIMTMYCIHSNAHIYNAQGDDARGRLYRGYTPVIEDLWHAHRVNAILVSEDIYTGDYPYIAKGDLYAKINKILKYNILKSPEEAELIKSIFDICLKHTTEISEDEFWSMCDVPIAPLY